MSKFDWDDPLWEAEFERGKIYQARVTYFNGEIEEGQFKYEKPWVNPVSVNGYESLIMPQFQRITPSRTRIRGTTLHAKNFEVLDDSGKVLMKSGQD